MVKTAIAATLVQLVLVHGLPATPASRACQVFCEGDLLDAVQRQRIFPDGKTFVDRPLRVDPEEAMTAFGQVNRSDVKALKDFVDHYFEVEGHELEAFSPPDFLPEPPMLRQIQNEELRAWTMGLHQLWKDLCRRQKADVLQKPQRYSALPQRHPVVIPGGRFRETYYWDTYWIVRGLLLSGLNQTARGVVENLLDYVRAFGFVPNGGRVYYLDRSQPPMLTEMVHALHEAQADGQWLEEVLPVLEKEYAFWMNATLGHWIPSLELNVYFSNGHTPRPESYFEDVATAKAASGREDAEVYQSIRSGAESGWDFSSRWLGDGEHLSSIQAERVVPVDLNCVLLRMERLLAFHLSATASARAERYARAARRREKAMQRFLWSPELNSFRDFRLDTQKHSEVVSISDFAAPFWAGLPKGDQGSLMLQQLQHSGLLQEGGASTTTKRSGQQWDAPNAWAPLQLMLIEGLESYGSLAGAMPLAEDLSQKWLRNCFEAWQKHKAMFEKYDAFRVGEGGGGGEYVPQTGFGWSNGVAMVLLAKNGNRSKPFVPAQRIILA